MLMKVFTRGASSSSRFGAPATELLSQGRPALSSRRSDGPHALPRRGAGQDVSPAREDRWAERSEGPRASRAAVVARPPSVEPWQRQQPRFAEDDDRLGKPGTSSSSPAPRQRPAKRDAPTPASPGSSSTFGPAKVGSPGGLKMPTRRSFLPDSSKEEKASTSTRAESPESGTGGGAEGASTSGGGGGSDGGAEDVYPTFVPRNPGISDGVWDKRDALVVEEARKDAKAASGDKNGIILLGKSVEELEDLAESHGQPRFRGRQLMDGLNKGAKSIDDIAVIPQKWRERLRAEGVRSGRSILQHTVSAPDGTKKMLLQLSDGRVVETVGIPLDEDGEGRLTVCVSSQVGCPMRCTFCATGKGGFARNLLPHEIVDQVLTVQEEFGKRVSNVVFMGMGEPLLNLKSVTRAYELLNKQLGIGGRFITISTVGVPNAITKLAGMDGMKATLAVSLHAPNQALRESIIPSAKAFPLDALMAECNKYYNVTRRRVTFEYTLLEGINDEVSHAQELERLLRSHHLVTHVNLIPWNPVDDSIFRRPSNNRVHAFRRALEDLNVPVSIRITRGLEAAAACGQLRNQFQKVPMEEFALPS